jgi:hypothetical protein
VDTAALLGDAMTDYLVAAGTKTAGRITEPSSRLAPSETAMTATSTFSGRDRAILRAVAAGGAELALGTEPDLFLGGRCCCDQPAAHHLVRAGLIAAATLGLVGQRVAAALTPSGKQALGISAFAA